MEAHVKLWFSDAWSENGAHQQARKSQSQQVPTTGEAETDKHEFEPVLCDIVKPWNEAKKKEFGQEVEVMHTPQI